MPRGSRLHRSAILPWVSLSSANLLVQAKLTIISILFYLSKWYTKKELNLRMSLFYAGSLLSGAFGSLIAAGILKGLAGHDGLDAWQW
jgi:hypothetical protein